VDFAIPPVDFAMMARATGAEAFTVRDADELDLIDWQTLAARQGPTLLDVHIDPEEKPPLNMA
jgi:acetolactate synthase-1/2/3 large subunit